MFIEKPFFLWNFPPNKGLTDYFFQGSTRKKGIFWDFVQKRLLFQRSFRNKCSHCHCIFLLGGVGNFSHKCKNCGQTPFEKHGLDKETEERDR